MNRKVLFLAAAMAMGAVSAAHADGATSSYDGRWYVAPTVGGYYNDTDRNTNSRQIYYGVGVGRFFSKNVSVDLFADRTKRVVDSTVGGGQWSNNNYGVAVRYYLRDWDQWRPYLVAGVMGSQHHSPVEVGWAPAAELGLGVSKTASDSTDVRFEAGYRYDWDNKSIKAGNVMNGMTMTNSKNGFGDWFLGLSIVSRIGVVAPAAVAAPSPPPPPPPPVPKCPNPPKGAILGPDGCPMQVTIDLRGVNFKFDHPNKKEMTAAGLKKALAEPSAESIAILDQAVDTLQRYPQVRVKVAGYTDSVGTDAYNQLLSERRAKVVYDYLTSHGISASRLDGPLGFGESNPIDSNDTEAGRARNRRTELQVENQP